MDLINTDGLAIFGPGSEWFWTMLQFTALSVTFVAIYRQLRVQHLQIRENTKLLRSQAHYNATWLSQRPWEMLMDNEGLAAVWPRSWRPNTRRSSAASMSARDIHARSSRR